MLRIFLSEGNSSYEGAKSSTSVRFSLEGSKRNRIRLPKELEVEILLRLPVKSIRRCESVCKKWQKRIRSRDFVDLYYRRHRSLPCNSSSLDLHTTHIDKIPPGLWNMDLRRRSRGAEKRKVVISAFGPLSNGIYCLTSSRQDEFRGGGLLVLPGEIALYNPATNDYKLANFFSYGAFSLIRCNEGRERRQYNLGFGGVQRKSPSRGLDYKVVVLLNQGLEFSSSVYCFRSGRWKVVCCDSLKVAVEVQIPYEVCPQSYFHGCWHWMALTPDGSLSVLSFNFAEEAFNLMGGPPRQPDLDRDLSMKGSVFVLHDHLAVIHLFNVAELQCVAVSVWVMKQYGVEDSWDRVYAIRPSADYGGGVFSRLAGIDSRFENGSISINKLYFEEDGSKQIICCDDAGSKPFCTWDNACSVVCWNTPGISTYVPCLKRFTTSSDPFD